MSEFFLRIINMSISASWIVLAVLVLRPLLKCAPKWITVLLWGVVAIRLVCPFSIESAISLIPSAHTVSPEIMMESTPKIDSGVPVINSIVNPVFSSSFPPNPATSANPLQILIPILSAVWIVGIAVMLLYTVISYFRVKIKVITAIRFSDNVFQSEKVVSPFVLGIIKPKIYLPFNIAAQDMEHVIAHENAHIRRKDHLWKPLGFLILTLHWFNPFVWLGYVLLCRDIELACDEKVIKNFNNMQKADYSQALLSCSVNRRLIAACPLAFGEVGVKNRVKSVLNYKKPAFWIVVTAIVISIAVAICFLTNPIDTGDKVLSKLIRKDYEVVEQVKKDVTLTIPLSRLPESIFSEKGKTFGKNEIVAYTDSSTSIYLKQARYSNEGNDNLYFCFDFDFDLSEKQGVFIYPYEITDIGMSGSVYTTTGILKSDNGEFANAVSDRGQGSGNLIWFYLSTDALKKAQGIISFDIQLNEITYFSDSPFGNYVGGPTNIGELKTKYPQLFNVSTDGGLTVYVWQTSKDSYSCYLENTAMEAISDNSFTYDVGTTIAEMRAILTTYDIDKKDITVQPVNNPLSSYYYVIDNAYRAKIKQIFWADIPI